MSVQTDPPRPKSLDERIQELAEFRDELELIAQSDVPYAKYARNALELLDDQEDDE